MARLLASVKEYFRNPQAELEYAVMNHRGSHYYITTTRELLEQYHNIIDIDRPVQNYIANHGFKDWPLLMYVAHIGDQPICQLLIDYGADIAIRGEYGDSALSIAVENEHINICNILVEAGADINQLNGNTSLLHLAALYRRYNSCQFLIEHDIDVNLKDNFNNTPLHIIVQYADSKSPWSDLTKICTMLLEAGADPQDRNDDGKTVLELVPTFAHGLVPILNQGITSTKYAGKR